MKKYLWILVALIYIALVFLVIRSTPSSATLLNDAQAFVDLSLNPFASKHFIDLGYPLVLYIFGLFVGPNNLIAMQILNYLLWVGATYFIALSLKASRSVLTIPLTILMLFSPLFLTFSAKLYSEPLSAFGVALLVFGLSASITWPLLLGAVIVVTTKSIFYPAIIILSLYLLATQLSRKGITLMFLAVLLIPYFLGSLGGGRTLYNLAIERAKLDLGYDQIVACAPYYLSYPLGQQLLPKYEGVCRQNDVISSLPGAIDNPYSRAGIYRAQGFSYLDWVKSISAEPLKYLLVFTVGLFNLVLFEGVYPSILLQMSGVFVVICYLLFKLILNLYLWSKVFIVTKQSPILLLPFVYLFIMIGNFQVEPRYIYPLLPYIYYLAGRNTQSSSRADKDSNHR